MLDLQLPSPSEVQAAADRLRGIARPTPLLRSERLSALCDGDIYVKLESLQRTGAFKFRGAFNCVSRLDMAEFPDGVLAYSTGNHGQAIATVAMMLGTQATVVMPTDAPSIKIEKARQQGARIVQYDRTRERREEIAEKIGRTGRYVTIPPGDHRHVIAGQGTVALEILIELGSRRVDALVVPCGGGGLAAGTCLARDLVCSSSEVWVAEPIDFDDTRRSLTSGNRELNPTGKTSICDALLAPTPAGLPFEINRGGVARGLVSDDAHVLKAMQLLFEEFRVVVEPGGAVAVAAILSDPTALRGKVAALVASGGNVDSGLCDEIIRGAR
ncbi:threonine ammonia-lyase [Paraburkholderia caledonica]|uniref:threonine ammonia-lyase n=1 Tax=Paraburkholderia caledonica TaxID=134536 RepID=UPI000489FC60|nr:threonine/serine dehydratase [Paraburkholderia caledonica]